MQKLINIILIIFLSHNIAFAQTIVKPVVTAKVDIQNISNRKYFQTTLDSINNAKSSIYMTMYFISLSDTQGNSKVLQLVNALIAAHKRGLKIKIILDRTFTFTSSSGQGDPRKNDVRNQVAYTYLKSNGLEVYYEDITNYTHIKSLIIDEETVIIGSTNWTTSALTKNNEASLLIKSKSLAQELTEDFNKIQLDQEEEYIDNSPKVELPISFMPIFEKFIEKHDEKLFSMYLYFIQKANFEFETEKEFEYKELRELFQKGATSKEFKQNYYLREYIKRLEKRYGLIKYLNPKNTTDPIKLMLSSEVKGKVSDQIVISTKGENQSFTIPQSFCNTTGTSAYLANPSIVISSTAYGGKSHIKLGL
ncbi:MAG: hypothetical protein GY817_05010 [bacterium]|nr:hypothetical protein [bacterium]